VQSNAGDIVLTGFHLVKRKKRSKASMLACCAHVHGSLKRGPMQRGDREGREQWKGLERKRTSTRSGMLLFKLVGGGTGDAAAMTG
jgi:hypothetical protein